MRGMLPIIVWLLKISCQRKHLRDVEENLPLIASCRLWRLHGKSSLVRLLLLVLILDFGRVCECDELIESTSQWIRYGLPSSDILEMEMLRCFASCISGLETLLASTSAILFLYLCLNFCYVSPPLTTKCTEHTNCCAPLLMKHAHGLFV